MTATLPFRLQQLVSRDFRQPRVVPRSALLLICAIAFALCPALARAQSALDGFNPGANGTVKAMVVQADGKIIVGGEFTSLGGVPQSHIGRLNADGSLDLTFDHGGADLPVWALAVQDDGKILVGGNFSTLGGASFNCLGRLNADGSADNTFAQAGFSTPGVRAIVIQPDTKIVVGGNFTVPGGGTNVARVSSGGVIDATFVGTADDNVRALALQQDGRILIGGNFSQLDGTGRNSLGRLNTDGTLDTSFNPGPNSDIATMVVQPDGKIVVGGDFTAIGDGIGSTMRKFIARLNGDGSLDPSFDPGADSGIIVMAAQPDGKLLVGGTFGSLGGSLRANIGRLNFNGTIDSTFDPGADSGVHAFVVQGDGGIVVGGQFGMLGGGGSGHTSRLDIGRLYADGTVDADYNPYATDAVFAVATQADGKTLIGGAFTQICCAITRNHIARLNLDGTVDAFDPNADGNVNAIAVQADGKILIGGAFTHIGLSPMGGLARLNADGSLDPAFVNPTADGAVNAIAVQSDGQIVVGGAFSTLGGSSFGGLARLNKTDGSGEAIGTFAAPSAVGGPVNAVAIQPDGGIVIGGAFTQIGIFAFTGMARVNDSGIVDSAFTPNATGGAVNAVVVQPDGHILAGGTFTNIAATVRSGIARLLSTGAIDPGFDPGAGADGAVNTLALQADGKIIAGGAFANLRGATHAKIGRLASDGTLDGTFDGVGVGADNTVHSLAIRADGKVLVGGDFVTLFGIARNKVGRVTNTGGAIQSLALTAGGSVATWSRSGVGPEFSRVTFEQSTGGAFSPVGIGTFVPGTGWRATGLTLPNNFDLFIRARGYYGTGKFDGSGSVIESVRNAYLAASTILPSSLPPATINSPYSVTFTAPAALGTITWSVSGSLPTGTIAMDPVTGILSGTPTQTGAFPITVTATDSSCACASASNLTLTVGFPSAPIITLNPVNQTVNAGQFVTFTVAATGGPTPTFQWQVSTDGGGSFTDLTNVAPYGGTTTTSLTISSATGSLGGNMYHAVASNSSGTATSTAATLTVSAAPVFTTQPADQAIAVGASGAFTVAASGSPTFQWQISTNGGSIWSDLANSGVYGGVTTSTLTLTGATADLNTAKYRAVATNVYGVTNSIAATLTITGVVTITAQPPDQTVASGLNVSFTVAAAGTGTLTYQWQISTNGGAFYSSLADGGVYSGTTTATLQITGAPRLLNGAMYRAFVSNGGSSATSRGALLGVSTTSNPRMSLDLPSTGATVGPSFPVAGWAVNLGAGAGTTGIDAIHVYAFQRLGDSFGPGVFLGASYAGTSRGDVAAVFGNQFLGAGFSIQASGLPAGTYRIVAYAHSSVSNSFSNSRSADITVAPFVSIPLMALDTPKTGTSISLAFVVSGWAVDLGSESDTGIDAVHVYAFPITGSGLGVPIFLGQASLNVQRPDVAAVFGNQFLGGGYTLQASGLAPGQYRIIAYARSTVTGTFNDQGSADVTIASPGSSLAGGR